jgi:hypothetical protein
MRQGDEVERPGPMFLFLFGRFDSMRFNAILRSAVRHYTLL